MTGCKHILPLLPEYLDKTLSETELTTISVHLASCTSCSVEFKNLSKLFETISESKAVMPPSQAYWSTILPRINARIGRVSGFLQMKWIEHVASPVGAAMLLVIMVLRLMPSGNGSTADNFQSVLRVVETEQLEAVSEEHELASLIELKSYDDDETDIQTSLLLILEEESTDLVYAYMGSDQILNNLNEEELSNLVNILNTKQLSN